MRKLHFVRPVSFSPSPSFFCLHVNGFSAIPALRVLVPFSGSHALPAS